MFALYINLESLHTVLDNLVRDFFKRYISNPTSLLDLFCRSYDIFVSVYWLLKIPLWGVSGVLNEISYFTPLLNTWFIWLIIYGWEILRAILARSRSIVHPDKSYSSPIDPVTYYFLMYSIVLINSGLSSIYSVPSTYTIPIKVLSFYIYI